MPNTVHITPDSTITIETNPIDDVNTVIVDGAEIYNGDLNTAISFKELYEGQRDRARKIQGLRQLADFLEEHPGLPILWASVSGNSAFMSIEPDLFARHAETLQVEPDVDQLPHGEIKLRKDFDGRVSYVISARADAVCTPVIVDGKVHWQAPSTTDLPAAA